MQEVIPTVWTLRSGLDQRFRSGHPWVFSNELTQSPKGLIPGSPVELRTAQGAFLARGYGNPASLISFRALSRDPHEKDCFTLEFLARRLLEAASLRRALGLGQVSHRWIFGEADFLPGLIIDRYRVEADRELIVIQAHTAGADLWVKDLPQVLESVISRCSDLPWDRVAVLLRNDVGIRELEGLRIEEPRVLKAWAEGALGRHRIVLKSAKGKGTIALEADLLGGQKTAFFLDQAFNLESLVRLVSSHPPKILKVLDLCCYVGQWGSQLAHAFVNQGVAVAVTAVDASQGALELAELNLKAQGAHTQCLRQDVLEGLPGVESDLFDIVVCDPPALIKGRKNLGPGKHAYLKLNTEAMKRVKPGGYLVSCSCSGVLDEPDFTEILGKAAHRAGQRIQWVVRGGPSPDHPVLAEFPEGRYLKCWIGRVSET